MAKTELSAYGLLATAAAFAGEAHKSQMRKELNEPYIVHPLRVGEMAAHLGCNAEFIAAAYLHDTVEDTETTPGMLAAVFPARVSELVSALTKTWSDGDSRDLTSLKDAYYSLILKTPGAPLLKVLDRIDNLNDMTRTAPRSPTMRRWANRYLAKTLEEFPPVLSSLANTRALALYDASVASLARTLAAVAI